MSQFDFDVIILGAGPAGLSVGAELSKKFKVLVVDRGELPNSTLSDYDPSEIPNTPMVFEPTQTTKFWFTPWDCLYDNPDIIDCRLEQGVKRFVAKTFTGPQKNQPWVFDLAWPSKLFPEQKLQDRYPYIDEYKVLAKWTQILSQSPHGSTIKYEHYYRDHEVKGDHVEVRLYRNPEIKEIKQSKETVSYTAKLLLDATGHDSDVRNRYDEKVPNLYWWSVYGCIIKHEAGQIGLTPEDGKYLTVGDYMLWQTFASSTIDPRGNVQSGRPIFEYEILDETTSFVLILYLRTEKISLDSMKSEFLDILGNEEGTAPFRAGQVKEFKYGWYPSGNMSRSFAQDRVDFIGDSGLWTTPCGWGMSYILKNYRPYCQALEPLLQQDRLERRDLRNLLQWKHAKKGEFLLNTFATRFLANGTTDQLDRFISLFNQVDPLICEKIFTLRVEFKDLMTFGKVVLKNFSIWELYQMIPPKERAESLLQLAGVAWQYIGEGLDRLRGKVKPERGYRVY